MTFRQGNPIVTRAIIKGLGRDSERAAEAREDGQSRGALDAAELRELERAEYYVGAPTPPPVAPAPRRSLRARLFGR